MLTETPANAALLTAADEEDEEDEEDEAAGSLPASSAARAAAAALPATGGVMRTWEQTWVKKQAQQTSQSDLS